VTPLTFSRKMRSSRDFRARISALYDAIAARACDRQHIFRFGSPLHNRSNAVSLGAVVALPTFNTAWLAPDGGGRQITILIVLASIAVVALLIAGAAFLNGQGSRNRRGARDDEVFATTPIPMDNDDVGRSVSPHHAFSTLRIPRWVQGGSLLAALGITWVVAQRIGPNDVRRAVNVETVAASPSSSGAADDMQDSPEDLDLTPDSSPSFAFRVRDWVSRSGGGCSGRLEVTKGAPSSWSLTARVHDGQGQLIDTARARVTTLREGEIVEFSFPRAACDRIGAWDVRGAPRDQ